MIIKKCLIVLLLVIPLHAATNDDEIIKNLDFFQNVELLKDDNPYIAQIEKATEPQKEKASVDTVESVNQEKSK